MRSNQLSYLAIILLSYQDLLSYQESNLDLQSQNLSCCHYTIAQCESERKGIQFLENTKIFYAIRYLRNYSLMTWTSLCSPSLIMDEALPVEPWSMDWSTAMFTALLTSSGMSAKRRGA